MSLTFKNKEQSLSINGKESQWTICRLKGAIDASTLTVFQSSLEELLKNKKFNVALNMEGVNYITSSGLGSLVNYMELFKEHEGSFALTGASEQVQNVILMMNLNFILPVYEGIDDLIENYGEVDVSEEELAEGTIIDTALVEEEEEKESEEEVSLEGAVVVLAFSSENIFTELLKDKLQEKSATVYFTKSTGEAYKLIENKQANVALIDYQIPKSEALCAKIKMSAETGSCAVVRVCPKGEDLTKTKGVSILPNQYLNEPCSHLTLCSVVSKVAAGNLQMAGTLQQELHLCIPNILGQVEKANAFVSKLILPSLKSSKKKFLSVRTSVREALDNAFRHGNSEDASKIIQLHYIETEDSLRISVKDQGEGFDTKKALASMKGKSVVNLSRIAKERVGGGLGIPFMLASSSKLWFNPKGNTVTQVIQLK